MNARTIDEVFPDGTTWMNVPLVPWEAGNTVLFGDGPELCDSEIHGALDAPPAVAINLLVKMMATGIPFAIYRAQYICQGCKDAMETISEGFGREFRAAPEYVQRPTLDAGNPFSPEDDPAALAELPICPPCKRGDCGACMSPDHDGQMYRCDWRNGHHRDCGENREPFDPAELRAAEGDFGIPGGDE